MSPPNKIYHPEFLYDDANGVCRMPEEPLVCEAAVESASLASSQFDYSLVSRSRIFHEAFGAPAVRQRPRTIWESNPLGLSGWSLVGGIPGCGGDDTTTNAPGDPIAFVEPLGGETTLNSTPITGNLDGLGFSTGSGQVSAAAWSAFDGDTPSNTGTFAFLRSGSSGGSQHTVSSDMSSRHLGTAAAVLNNGETVVVYTRSVGLEDPTSIVAQRISSSGTPLGSEITVFPNEIWPTLPTAQVIALESGFMVVYRRPVQQSGGKWETQLAAAMYDLSGSLVSENNNLGPAPDQYAITHGAGNHWGLAEVLSPSRVRVRTFDALSSGMERTINVAGFSSAPNIALAMQEDNSMMLAWNAQEGSSTSSRRIDGALISSSGNVDGPFLIRQSTLANSIALTTDHRFNYIFAWEEKPAEAALGGRISAYVFNGTRTYRSFSEFSNLASGSGNSNIQVSVSPDGILSFVYNKTSMSGADTLHNITRRDYRITYE